MPELIARGFLVYGTTLAHISERNLKLWNRLHLQLTYKPSCTERTHRHSLCHRLKRRRAVPDRKDSRNTAFVKWLGGLDISLIGQLKR